MAGNNVLAYGSDWWTNGDAFDDDPSQFAPSTEANAKFATYMTVSGDELRGCKGVHEACLTMGMDGTMTARTRMQGGGVSGSFSRSDFTDIFGDDPSQPHCNQNGLNQNWTYAGYRFGHVGNNEGDCSSCDSAFGWGIYGQSNTGSGCGAGLAGSGVSNQCVHGTLWVR